MGKEKDTGKTYRTPKVRNKRDIILRAIANGDIEDYARAGATNKTIATALGMSEDTFYKYLNHPEKRIAELSEALMRGRKPVVLKVMGAMVKKAQGYEYEEKVVTKKQVINRFTGEIETLEEESTFYKHMPPETNAGNRVLMNYLKHAKRDVPDNWQNDPARSELQERSVVVQESKGRRAEEDDY